MRLALVRQRYNPYGGAERFIERALPALERAGIEPTLIAREHQGWGARRVLRVDPFSIGSTWRDRSFARAARDAWSAGGFDLVQSHERIPGCHVYRAGDGVHAAWLDIRRAERLGEIGIGWNPYHRYTCQAEREMFEHPALRAVVCNSSMVREEILARFRVAPEKLHVIYNGVDLEHFHSKHRSQLREAARAELRIEPGETLFLFVGSGFARKGLDAAIAALAATGEKSFRLAAAGRDRDATKFSGRALLLGGRDDVRPLYAAADCFILPTRYDPFPNTVLEALAMGLPVIVGKRSGAAEILQAGSGWTCEPGDARGIAEAMRAAARAAREPATMTAARSVAERYGIDDMARKLVALYGTLT